MRGIFADLFIFPVADGLRLSQLKAFIKTDWQQVTACRLSYMGWAQDTVVSRHQVGFAK